MGTLLPRLSLGAYLCNLLESSGGEVFVYCVRASAPWVVSQSPLMYIQAE